MTTQEVANRYYELANQSKWTEIQDELHDANVLSKEPQHVAAMGLQVETRGREALKAKGQANREMMEALHSQYCGEPVVAGDFFSLVLRRDVTFKGRPRAQKEEIGVFHVQNGKIISEEFFY